MLSSARSDAVVLRIDYTVPNLTVGYIIRRYEDAKQVTHVQLSFLNDLVN